MSILGKIRAWIWRSRKERAAAAPRPPIGLYPSPAQREFFERQRARDAAPLRLESEETGGPPTDAYDGLMMGPAHPNVLHPTSVDTDEYQRLQRVYQGADPDRIVPGGINDPSSAMGPRSQAYAESRLSAPYQPTPNNVKTCVEGGPLHNFQPRYSESRVPVVFRNLNLRQTRATDMARLIEAQTTYVKAYACDVCQWCGKVVNQQTDIAVAAGPKGEKTIDVHIEGEHL